MVPWPRAGKSGTRPLFGPGTAFQRDCRRLSSSRGCNARCSRCRQPWTPRSALRRHHLAADFAGLMFLRVHVDVPLAGGELLRLLGGQRRFSLDRRLDGLPLGLSQITGGPFLPAAAGPWKWAMVAGPDSPL